MNPFVVTGWRMRTEDVESAKTDLRLIARLARLPSEPEPSASPRFSRFDRNLPARRDPVTGATLSTCAIDPRQSHPHGTAIHRVDMPDQTRIIFEQPMARPGGGYGFDFGDATSEVAWLDAVATGLERLSEDPDACRRAENAMLRHHLCIMHHLGSMLPKHVDPSLLRIRIRSPMLLPHVGLEEWLGEGPEWRDEGPCGLLSEEAAIAWTRDVPPLLKLRGDRTGEETSYRIIHASMSLEGSSYQRDPMALIRDIAGLPIVPDALRLDLLEKRR